MDELSAGKKAGNAPVTTVMQPNEPYTIEGGEGAKGAGYPIAVGGVSPAGDSPICVKNPQGNTQGDASFVEAARKYKV